MSTEQPGKIGKIGYFMALMGLFLCIAPLLDLLSLSMVLWDVPFLVLGVVLLLIAYTLVSKDTYMRKLGRGFLMWRPSTIRDSIATFLILASGLWVIPMISVLTNPPFTFNPWGYGWLLAIAVAIALLIGWTLILTEREAPAPPQAHKDSTTTI